MSTWYEKPGLQEGRDEKSDSEIWTIDPPEDPRTVPVAPGPDRREQPLGPGNENWRR